MLSNNWIDFSGVSYGPLNWKKIHGYTIKYVVIHKQFKFVKGENISLARAIYDISLLKTKIRISFGPSVRVAYNLFRPSLSTVRDAGAVIHRSCSYVNYGCKTVTMGFSGCEVAGLSKVPIYVYPDGDITGGYGRLLAKNLNNRFHRAYPTMRGGILMCDNLIVGIGSCYDCIPFSIFEHPWPNRSIGFSNIGSFYHFINYTMGYSFNKQYSPYGSNYTSKAYLVDSFHAVKFFTSLVLLILVHTLVYKL